LLASELEMFGQRYAKRALSAREIARLEPQARGLLETHMGELDEATRERHLRHWREAMASGESGSAGPISDTMIHLRNVRVHQAGLPPMVGVWWRGRLAAVDGFILGRLAVPERSVNAPESS